MQKYDISGMSCAACSARVQKAVERLPGVNECQVNLLTNSMTVSGTAKSDSVIAAVKNAGYGASVAGERKSAKKKDKNSLIKRFLWSSGFLLALMYISMGHGMLKLPLPSLFIQNPIAAGLAQAVLCLIIMFINRKFFISGAKGVLHFAPNMDTLVALGSFASFAYSAAVLYKTAAFSDYFGQYYFESAAMILTLITLGKMLEERAKGKTASSIESLIKLAPDTATVISGGERRTVPISEIKVGDIIAVHPGESFAVDGVVLSGESAADESALTGESMPAEKRSGSRVFSGTVNLSGYIEYKAQSVGSDTVLQKIVKTVSDAASSKAPIAKIADKVAGVFVPAVLVIALITAAVWLMLSAPFSLALSRAVSVLVISCPCALGLATPVAIMVSSGVGAKYGILFKNAAAIEQTGKAKIIAVDKTGTITEGKPTLTDIYCAKGVKTDKLLSVALSLEEKSEHPLSLAIVEYCRKKGIKADAADDFTAVSGSGVKGVIGGEAALGGTVKFISESIKIESNISEKTEEFAKEGKTPVVFALGGKVLGVIGIADKIKPQAAECVLALKSMGLFVVMLSGDNNLTAAAVAKTVGTDKFFAELMPNDKAEKIKELQSQGSVIMVGDGINDAPALTLADTGIAIGTGTDIAIDSASVVITGDNLFDIVSAIKLSRSAYKNIEQNLFWAFFYNAACIPLAAGAFSVFGVTLNPMIAAAAMSMSSVFVVSNALRLNSFKPYKNKKEKTVMKEIKIEGIMCEHCEARIKEALEAVKGVKAAKVSKETGTAQINTDGDVDDNMLFLAIKNAGYEVVK